MAKAHFTSEFFDFFTDLAQNNERAWFATNKTRFEEHVRGPILDFINDFAPKLAKIGPAFVADSRPSGGSMFRIYRDTRFAKDKTPYKTHGSMHFRHRVGKDVHAPGFYLHLEPGRVFMGAGIWHPEPKIANQIRQAIVESPSRWTKATTKKALRSKFEFSGESLKRKPRALEVDDDHPLIEDLKRKDFIVIQNFEEAEVLDPGFLNSFAASCRIAGGFMHFLTDALNLDF